MKDAPRRGRSKSDPYRIRRHHARQRVGLHQGQALDDYADEARQAQARARDEKQHWNTIPASDLNACNSSLSFFDSQGMRFHLPAFLLAELDGTFGFSLCFHLAYSTDPASRFSALN